MGDKFIQLADGFYVSPQITPAEVREAAKQGVKLIICNRPDGEEAGQPSRREIEKAAADAGIAFVSIPVSGAGVSDSHLDEFDAAMANCGGPVLGYCRSGTRSTVVWALARARAGDDPVEIMSEAAAAGYNLSNIAPRLVALSKSGGR